MVAPISLNISMDLLGTDLEMSLYPINFPAMDGESNPLRIIQFMGANLDAANAQNDHNYPKLALANFTDQLSTSSARDSAASFAYPPC